MFLLLILAIGFYLYQTGELQRILSKFQSNESIHISDARRVIDLRYAAGKISTEEYSKIKDLL
ncbi:hypothetical protein CVD25_23110 [Bacillus canaveralius]|uniref:SHOCT domain-containing protein n=1 Tax=Bacillus canaveralius TaxID=1403243 RepID=A0A2N5GGA6_9BACI|nr:hypothetical protein [Bacillus canaveralius]PLR79761.1 hypothetical protein CU635_21345 [Bacillus canaveralius]PLR88011.1 hypothetical protein CVD25_23110 [Bacillus canaveralius]